MTLRAIDAWIGKTLFLPPIIWFCQRTRQSQFAVSRLFWFIAAMDAFYHAESWFSSILWGALCVIMMVTASLTADSPTRSLFGWRLLSIAFLFLDIVNGATRGTWAGIEFWLFVLIAEYAATIRTIPPLEDKKRSPRTAAQRL